MPTNNPYLTNDEYNTKAFQAGWGTPASQPHSPRASATHAGSTSAQGLLSPMRLAASLRKSGLGSKTPSSPSFPVPQTNSNPRRPAPNPQHSDLAPSGPSSDEELARLLQAEEDAAFNTYDRRPAIPMAGPSSPVSMRSPVPNPIPREPEIPPPPGWALKGKAPANSNWPAISSVHHTGTYFRSNGITPMMHLSTVQLGICSAYNRMMTRCWRECCRKSSNKNFLKIQAI